MLPVFKHREFWTLSLCALLAACGGGSRSSADAASLLVTASTPSADTTLLVSPTVLALKASGSARSFTVTNTGASPALLVEVDPAVVLPLGTTYLNHCATLAPGASCTITITPGALPSAAPGVPAPVPVTLAIQGSNASAQAVQVHVLDYGSVYQGGHVFAFNEAVPSTQSVGGKVAAISTAATYNWSHHFAGPGPVFEVFGVSDDSVGPAPDCNGKFDGACNTQLIVTATEHAGVPLDNYAAGACRSTLHGYADWYLPAICEMSNSLASGCPGGETMQEKLQTPGYVHFADSWSSTQANIGPVALAWRHVFATLPAGDSQVMFKNVPAAASCVRQFNS